MDSPNQSRKSASIKWFKSRSFPRAVGKDTAFAVANSGNINSPNSPAYTSLKDLMSNELKPPVNACVIFMNRHVINQGNNKSIC
jgi:hypothetical protein